MNIAESAKWLLSVVGAVAIGAVGARNGWLWPAERTPYPPPLVAVEKLADLVSLRVHQSNVFDFSAPLRANLLGMEIFVGATNVLLVARGDCTVAVDLGLAAYENVQADARALTVVLPKAMRTESRLNLDNSRGNGTQFFAITNSGLQAILPDANAQAGAMRDALNFAQVQFEQTCKSAQVARQARDNAETVLRGFLGATGYTPRVEWR